MLKLSASTVLYPEVILPHSLRRQLTSHHRSASVHVGQARSHLPQTMQSLYSEDRAVFLACMLERTHDVSVLPSLHYSVLESERLAEGLRAAFQTLRY